MNILYLILCAIYFPIEISGARILAMFAYSGKSHWQFYRPLMVALAEKGHNVTVVGHYPQRPAKVGYTDISLAGTLPTVENTVSIEDIIADGRYGQMSMQWVPGYKTCELIYKNKKIQELAKSTAKYDVLITELFAGDCFHPFAYKFQVPMIGITSSAVLPFSADFINLPENPSYIPSYVLPYSNNMSFMQRVKNTLILVYSKLGYHFFYRRNTDRLAREWLFPEMPPLLEISNNISLIISNSHFTFNGAKPVVPALVEAAGMHIKKVKDFHENLAFILDKSLNGIVYFSFGTLIKSETLSLKKLKTILSVFSTIKETVLWKVDGVVLLWKVDEELPKNVVLEQWMPQVDILCHPNVKAFITHGGMLSCQEAVYCGVPMIGIPFFAEQEHNIKNVESQGIAVHLDLHNITEASLGYALDEVLDNPEYKVKAQYASQLFRDRIKRPLDVAVYWTEYIIKYKGAPHLKTSARNLNWFQYFLLDVISLMLIFIFVIALLVKILYSALCKLYNPQRVQGKVKLF